MSVRQMWKAKLEGRPMPAAIVSPAERGRTGESGRAGEPRAAAAGRTRFIGTVLGIDPSLRGTGLALVEFTAAREPLLLRSRTVKVPASRPMSFALAEIHRSVVDFLGAGNIRHVALEQTIFVQNFQTAQILGAARGAAIAAAALQDLPIFEYPPLRVKMAVVGSGRASKAQVARTVMTLLGHGRTLALDEADAAGVALCHAFTWRG
jgi:crossover junction endodeoxyribonuclease RuvC